MALCCSNIFAQQRHRLSNGEPYDIFLSVRPTAGMALGDFNKNYTYVYGADLAFEMQLEETKLGLGVTIGYNYCVPQSFKLSYLPPNIIGLHIKYQFFLLPTTIFTTKHSNPLSE